MFEVDVLTIDTHIHTFNFRLYLHTRSNYYITQSLFYVCVIPILCRHYEKWAPILLLIMLESSV